MNKKEIRYITKYGCFQQDIADCGVACVVTIMRYYGTSISLEYGRELSGTNAQGTTMYGLLLACNKMGFKAVGYELDYNTLCQQSKPIIVHVLLPNGLKHYVVFCGVSKNKAVVFDPAKGVVKIEADDFLKIWTQKCLFVEPSENKKKKTKEENRIFQFLFETIKNNVVVFVGLIIISILIALFGMATSVLFQKLIDDLLPQNVLKIVLLGIAVVSFLSIIKVVLSAVKQLLVVQKYKEIQETLVKRFLNKLLSLKITFFESRKIGDLVARLNDIRHIQSVVNYVIGGNTIVDIFIVIIGTCFVGCYAWQMAVIMIMAFLITLAYMIKTNGVIISRQRNVMVSYSNLESQFINTIKNIRSIKIGNLEKSVVESNSLLFQKYTSDALQTDRLQIRLTMFYGFVNVVLLGATMVVCAYLYNRELLSIGQFIAISSIVSIVSPSIVALSLLPISYNEAKTAFDRFFSTIDLPSEEPSGLACPQIQSIELNNLTFGFIGREPIVKNLSVQFVRGKINCLVGKSGKGKSTICKLLEKSYQTNDNSITINGNVAINSIKISDYRNRIGVVPQNIQLYEGTVLSNICIGAQDMSPLDYQKACEVCNKYGLLPYFNALPSGLLTVVGEAGVELSGGEKQLVAFARLLVQNPEVFILDEPTSAMDTELRNVVWNILAQLSSNHLIIVVSHQTTLFEKYNQHIKLFAIQ